MFEKDYRNYGFNRDQALRDEIMTCRDKFFMQSGVKGTFTEEREKLMNQLFGGRGRI